MGIQLWLAAGLAAIDMALVICLFFMLRTQPRMDRRALIATGAGLAGFVFHAFLFFDGIFLVFQLATLAMIFNICWMQHLGRLRRQIVSEVR